MLVSEDKAKLIAELSYEESMYLKNMGVLDYMDSLITYKKALELDEDTADNILERLIKRSNEFKFKDIAAKNRCMVRYIGHGMTIIDNYQYVDYYKYELNSRKDKAKMDIKFVDGDTHSFDVANLEITKDGKVVSKNVYGDVFYIPHIYEPLFLSKEYKVENLTELEMYLKLLIIEDREVNPYIIINDRDVKIVMPMRARIEFIDDKKDEVLLLDGLLKDTGGFLMFDTSNQLLKIEPMIEYLETVNKDALIELLSEYNNNDKLKTLSYLLDIAKREIFGLIIEDNSTKLYLL